MENGNGKGKTYQKRGALKYEGEYINGKLNGQVKKYQSGNDYSLEFEGEYFNGKKNGKGKEYHPSIFEGEYLDGKRHGKGKQYDYYFNRYGSSNQIKMEFEGEYYLGKRKGFGKEYSYRGALIFEGEYLNDEKWNGKIYKDPYEGWIE